MQAAQDSRTGVAGALLLAFSLTGAAPARSEEAGIGLSLFGVPGYVNMPSAYALPDGHFALSVNAQGDMIRRGNLVFQIAPRVTGVFRYGYLRDFDTNIGGSLYDRSFDLVWQLADEDPAGWRPAIAIGLQDFGGTGIYGAEYIVASRRFGPKVTATAGLGWGRLASHGGFSSPLSWLSDRFDVRPASGNFKDTGKIGFDRFFRGDAALFFGLDWQSTDRLRFSVEYSSDGMIAEARDIGFKNRSQVNLGLDYRLGNGGTLKLAYLHGSTLALGYSMVFNPARPAAPSGYEPGPPAVSTGRQEVFAKGSNAGSGPALTRLAQGLQEQGLLLIDARIEGEVAIVTLSNPVWPVTAQSWGRAMRVLSAELPAGISTFRLRSQVRGMAMREITLTRQDLEKLEYAPDGAWKIWSRVGSIDAVTRPEPSAGQPLAGLPAPGGWRLTPYLEPSLFDPDDPLRFDIGLQLSGEWSPSPGLWLSGALRQKAFGTLDESGRISNSVLPHVRSDAALYYKDGGPRIPWLMVEYFSRPGEDLYARLSAGLLEEMYGGVSAELLWAPVDSRLALGVEVNRVRQRDFDGFGFRDYEVTTGHVSAWYDLGGGYEGQLDIGRYLAGDNGATLTMTRRFGNGVSVGAFFTLTDAGFDDFGEGAFDKGITLNIPLSVLTGRPTRDTAGLTLRPVLRDGGARLSLRNRLYELTRPEREAAAGEGWARFWR